MSRKYKMPSNQNLSSRSSTISNAFAISVTPCIKPDESELEGYYEALGIKEGQCAYCVVGDGNGRDHLKPLVKDGMPTGYITDIRNLVPCCQKCNSSKGSKSFEEWYKSDDNLKRLRSLGLNQDEIEKRYTIIKEYESKIGQPLDYEKIVGTDKWNEYKKRRKALIEALNDNQKFCDMLLKTVLEYLNK